MCSQWAETQSMLSHLAAEVSAVAALRSAPSSIKSPLGETSDNAAIAGGRGALEDVGGAVALPANNAIKAEPQPAYMRESCGVLHYIPGGDNCGIRDID